PLCNDFEKSVEYWNRFISDENDHYDKTIKVYIEVLEPMVTWGINPQHAISISAKIPILKEIPTHQHNLAQQANDNNKYNA
ncbi:aconitase family protein, partial [Francisella tularensis subsp. holarctica]|uniref:aconitase family protein n=1 Tax=Francisella tularensis TaxID=263 RepID=UPI002381C25D